MFTTLVKYTFRSPKNVKADRLKLINDYNFADDY